MLREVLELTNRHRSRQLVSWMSSTGLGLKMGGEGDLPLPPAPPAAGPSRVAMMVGKVNEGSEFPAKPILV